MNKGIKLLVCGNLACFTEPWSKVERKSYDVITPSAARGILDAIYWKPAIRWVIDEIHVLNPIKFINIRKNEVQGRIKHGQVEKAMKKGDLSEISYVDINCPDDDRSRNQRQQRAMMTLRDVRYGIVAHFERTEKFGEQDNDAKHIDCFKRHALRGSHFHQPCLGMREFPASYELVENVSDFGETNLDEKDRDFGLMLWDIDFKNDNTPIMYNAIMKNGVINVAACKNGEKP